jgi:hypothetical protein
MESELATLCDTIVRTSRRAIEQSGSDDAHMKFASSLSTCKAKLVSVGGGHGALLQREEWEQAFTQVALRVDGTWRVGQCRLMEQDGVSAESMITSTLRKVNVVGPVITVRYVMGRFTGSYPEFPSKYEDHVAVFDAVAGSCEDDVLFSEEGPSGAPLSPIPDSWRSHGRP